MALPSRDCVALANASRRWARSRPRGQAGVRWRPTEIFSVDLIVGHNLTGENARWITLGTTVRFPEALK